MPIGASSVVPNASRPIASPASSADQHGGDVARLHAGWLRPHEDPSFPLQ